MRSAAELAELDTDADDVLHRMMDDASGSQSKYELLFYFLHHIVMNNWPG
jgi:hypothetical protein